MAWQARCDSSPAFLIDTLVLHKTPIQTELCANMYNLADKLVLPQLQAKLRHIFPRAYYGFRDGFREPHERSSEDPWDEEDAKQTDTSC